MKKGLKKIFGEVSRTYESANRILTFGLDAFWRRRAAKLAAEDGGRIWLDVCTGTGQTAFYLRRLAGKETTVVAADFCMPMVHMAVRKAEKCRVFFSLADAGVLPFRDETFDLITISFATRNININRDILTKRFGEFCRALKPQGRFVNLETSQPANNLARKLFHLYVRLAVGRVGYLISGSKDGYAYLSRTIPRFYGADDLADIIRSAGFPQVEFSRMTFGTVAVHKAVKKNLPNQGG